MNAAIVGKSERVFYMPSPKQDGSLLPVPYLSVSVGLRAAA